ncbi:MAG: phage terminase large subunit family protein [Alphaproteobacteria bacterium]|nr:phage terminase large subunit family protein [Alphaproteobacteria bacterium]
MIGIFEDIASFDGADALLRGWMDGLMPDPDHTVSTWADENRVLSPRGANEAGPWRTSRTPYLREIMDSLSPSSPCQRVVLMKGAQLGGSECGNNWIGYVIHHAPGPMLAVQPTVELGRRFSQQRIDPLIEESEILRERVAPARSRDSGNTILSKEFPGGILVITGANSAVGLRSMPARYLFLDEVDAYPASAGEEGDPVALAEARTRTFAWRRKVFLCSTPTIKGISRIEREYEVSDKRKYFVPCPFCGHKQVLQFERLRWEKGQPETVAYHCEHCEARIDERHKTFMLEHGEWRATAISADPLTVGYHISSLYSPHGWLSWERIAREWEAAQGNDETMKGFKNSVLGETWVESGEAPDWQILCERREPYRLGKVPKGGLFLTAGADVQKDRIEVDIWAWGRGLESWLVDHIVIPGGPDDPAAWDALAQLLTQTWPHENGPQLTIGKLAVDSGYEAPAVYAWTRKMGGAQVMAVKGAEGFNRASPVTGPTYVDVSEGGRKIRRGAKLWVVAGSTFKTETYRFLRLVRPTTEELEDGALFPPGTVHLPEGIDSEWIKQLTAEQLVTVKTKRGFSRLEWQKLRERNEALDCRVYARAAAWIVGIDRFSEARWKELEAQVAAAEQESADGAEETPRNAGVLRRKPQSKRRTFHSSYLR